MGNGGGAGGAVGRVVALHLIVVGVSPAYGGADTICMGNFGRRHA